jgi:excisionase family DNA binding protein
MLKAKEAAEFLNVHLETIRRLARQNEIPAFKVGKGWRFSEETLKKWADEHYSRNAAPHILVTDDEPVGCKLVTRILEPNGYRVSTALGGRQALEIMRRENVDLILLDLMMPEMNGAETLKEIRKLDENVPVIIITGYPDSDLMAQAMAVSPIFVIPKPLDKKQLFNAISMVLPKKEQRE